MNIIQHLILTSENVSSAYIDYLNQNNISWIATGKEHVDLKRAMAILADEFGIKRLAVVSGKINGGFLKADLVDEISILLGSGIDGRTGQPAMVDGLTSSTPVPLKLKSVQSYPDGAVWLRYLTK
ncbi:dihydrofolate reductase family protein [Lactobacillus acidophilus]|uniref:dihydrofolate reductase family protein n=2 Tax=Lactobacillus acidophilus TaxID=1579 RepID=UPI00030468A5|nr:dihydrofolate reductase family protein [Lactobacillus acidophilus]UIP46976.1 dihydrofolate reductase family protein [Lactobacillus acidophilus]UTX29125.1 dihydrofolate reductase family protein [Lactobacillus acidophilus]UUY10745.1 dihydrofolate reductase family protein [Lactobacillus acidophilus]UYB32872.1 dihydrofolate reductase family protein [Lactobacillus acidophilus]